MTVKGGRHQLTGIVSLDKFYNEMRLIESGKEYSRQKWPAITWITKDVILLNI